ncbi:ABC transporter permease [Secundilactobacillus paracollinoides]|nr:ABC transporter permease [Secundilactobacillus paracollinoides]KRL75332.1 hypothetical protein FC17_GL002648 [Secundilactobacillus paracollinoides DSM 15502 = JCM 11969]
MLNQLRADFYRQTHTIGHYLLLVLVLIYSFVTIYFKSVGGVMVSAPEDTLAQLASGTWTVLSGVRAMTIGASILMYAFISIFVMVIGYEFSQETYKNTLISGISRSGFIVAKYITMLVDILLQILAYYVFGILVGLAMGRKLGTSWGHLLSTTLATVGITTFFISVVFGMAVVLLILTGSQIGSAAFIVIFPLAVSIIAAVAHWHWLKYINFFSTTVKISVGQITVSQFWPYAWVSIAILAVCFLLSLGLIQRKEL